MLAMSGVLVRTAAATIFALSAVWKLAEPAAFTLAFRGLAPRRFLSAADPARKVLAALEMLIAAALLVGIFDRAVAVGGGVGALLLVGVFSIRVAQGRSLRECGCWAMPFVSDGERARTLILVRNSIVALVLAATVFTPAEPSIAAVVGGLIVGLLIVEAPQLIAVATHHRAWMASP
jgi:hypothetical protein